MSLIKILGFVASRGAKNRTEPWELRASKLGALALALGLLLFIGIISFIGLALTTEISIEAVMILTLLVGILLILVFAYVEG